MDLKQEKKELRKQISAKKKEFSLLQKKEMSFPVFEKIEQSVEFRNAKCVLVYWSMDDEVYTQDFVNKWYRIKIILLPCVEGDSLKLRQYSGLDSMIKGEQFGILEPKGPEFTDMEKIDLMIIPGVAFDRLKNRMGRGRGFYDRLLNGLNCWKIAVGFDFQVVDKVPSEDFDVKMDKIVTTSYIYQ